MGPRIQYARAADGVSIAFWTLGRGTPLVYLAGGPWSHVELWDIPECRRWYERLAEQRMLVRFDVRGTGLSERDVSDYSLEALLLDLEAVVDRLGLARFALFGAADAGPVAIAYAARHPERVARLVLWCAWARGADVQSPRIRAWPRPGAANGSAASSHLGQTAPIGARMQQLGVMRGPGRPPG